MNCTHMRAYSGCMLFIEYLRIVIVDSLKRRRRVKAVKINDE